MEFLVRTRFRPPPGLSGDDLADLAAAERTRAHELQAGGTLVALWRLPGTRDAVGVWAAADADALHAALTSLPAWPHLVDVTVEPLCRHPNLPTTPNPANPT
jgi:muconolactone D-isomerase